MGRYVTPRGVAVQTSDRAARSVGYQPVEDKPTEDKRKSAPRKPAAKSDEE